MSVEESSSWINSPSVSAPGSSLPPWGLGPPVPLRWEQLPVLHALQATWFKGWLWSLQRRVSLGTTARPPWSTGFGKLCNALDGVWHGGWGTDGDTSEAHSEKGASKEPFRARLQRDHTLGSWEKCRTSRHSSLKRLTILIHLFKITLYLMCKESLEGKMSDA